MTLIDIVNLLGACNTDKGKKQIIFENKDNECFTKMLDIVYNPKNNLQLTDFKLPLEKGDNTVEDIIDDIDYLINGAYTGNSAIDFITNLAKQCDIENQKLLQKIIRKNLRIDLGVKTINSVLPNFIPSLPYMRCALLNDKTIKNINFPCFIQTKLDGQYMSIVVSKTDVKFVSRTGTNYIFNDKFIKRFKPIQDIISDETIMLIGEALVVDEENVVLPREEGNGIINKASELNMTISSDEVNSIRFVLWDIINLTEFKNGQYNVPYKTRFENLRNLPDIAGCSIVYTNIVNNLTEAYDEYYKLISLYEEGAIIKDFNNIFKDTTSNTQLKMKTRFQVELKIIGFNNGKPGTQFEKGLGSLICESSDKSLVVDVGTGFKDNDRKEIFKNIDNIIGKIVTVEANRTLNKNNGWTLFLPVFIEIRHDKTECDSLDKILEIENSAKCL